LCEEERSTAVLGLERKEYDPILLKNNSLPHIWSNVAKPIVGVFSKLIISELKM